MKALLLLVVCLVFNGVIVYAQKEGYRSIHFCGEPLPLNHEYVAGNYLSIIYKLTKSKYNVPSMYKRASYFFPIIEPILARYGVPDDFKYLAVIESDFRTARSSAGAVGYWQFMEGTAKEFGLRVDSRVDERNDLIKSTHAACQYFVWLYKRLKSWTLVAAAYNGGVGMIERKIKKHGHANYYFLKMNRETTEYVLKISAVKELFTSNKSLEVLDQSYRELAKGKGLFQFDNRLDDEARLNDQLHLMQSGFSVELEETDELKKVFFNSIVFDKREEKKEAQPISTTAASPDNYYRVKVIGYVLDDRHTGHLTIQCIDPIAKNDIKKSPGQFITGTFKYFERKIITNFTLSNLSGQLKDNAEGKDIEIKHLIESKECYLKIE